MVLTTQLNPVPWPELAMLPDHLRLPFDGDVPEMVRDLARLEQQHWTPHFVPDHFAGDWTVLPLRAPAGAQHPILQISSNPGTLDWIDLPVLRAVPAIAHYLAALPCRLASVRLMRLAAGSAIHRHRDDDLDASRGMARLHVPLATNDAVDFRLNDMRIAMPVGECWYLRLSDPHSVRNDGNSDRVHLVIDAEVNDCLAEQLLAGANGS